MARIASLAYYFTCCNNALKDIDVICASSDVRKKSK